MIGEPSGYVPRHSSFSKTHPQLRRSHVIRKYLRALSPEIVADPTAHVGMPLPVFPVFFKLLSFFW